jgi:hypothetical protein
VVREPKLLVRIATDPAVAPSSYAICVPDFRMPIETFISRNPNRCSVIVEFAPPRDEYVGVVQPFTPLVVQKLTISAAFTPTRLATFSRRVLLKSSALALSFTEVTTERRTLALYAIEQSM